MYLVPLALIIVIALAIFVSPLLAVLLFVLALIGLGVVKFLGRATEPENAPRSDQAAAAAELPADDEGGAWGEQWPEERSPREQELVDRERT